VIVSAQSLVRGSTRSCGCLRRERAVTRLRGAVVACEWCGTDGPWTERDADGDVQCDHCTELEALERWSSRQTAAGAAREGVDG
jgi:hypothetical protein